MSATLLNFHSSRSPLRELRAKNGPPGDTHCNAEALANWMLEMAEACGCDVWDKEGFDDFVLSQFGVGDPCVPSFEAVAFYLRLAKTRQPRVHEEK